jgi:hypothetical protein
MQGLAAPLHPARMSMPMTCHPQAPFQRRDVLFYVLYGANLDYFRRLIEESVVNVAREYPSAGVADALQLMRPAPTDSLHALQIKFFLLLNEDAAMRRALANVKKGHATIVSLCPHKAERFYDDLCERLVPSWIQDCRVSHADFVDSLRAAYLCS